MAQGDFFRSSQPALNAKRIIGPKQPFKPKWTSAAGVRMARVQVEAVYAERNQLVAALCKLFPAVRYCDGVWTAVYVDLPTGQVSWHYGPRDAWLFARLPVAPANPWDGHDTRTKYARLNALQFSDAASAP